MSVFDWNRVRFQTELLSGITGMHTQAGHHERLDDLGAQGRVLPPALAGAKTAQDGQDVARAVRTASRH